MAAGWLLRDDEDEDDDEGAIHLPCLTDDELRKRLACISAWLNLSAEEVNCEALRYRTKRSTFLTTSVGNSFNASGFASSSLSFKLIRADRESANIRMQPTNDSMKFNLASVSLCSLSSSVSSGKSSA